jgi:hypothetical protein
MDADLYSDTGADTGKRAGLDIFNDRSAVQRQRLAFERGI